MLRSLFTIFTTPPLSVLEKSVKMSETNSEIELLEILPKIEEGIPSISRSKVQFPILKAYGRIGFDSSKEFVIPCIDKITDIISGVRYLNDGNLWFGCGTLAIPFFPSVFATLLHLKERVQHIQQGHKTCFGTFWRHLPGLQFWTHQDQLRKMANLQFDICEWQQGINELINQGDSENTQQRIKELEGWIARNQKDYYATRTQLQKFKIFAAVFESAPQFILQCSVIMKKVYACPEHADWYDCIFWLQTTSSIASIFVTFTGVTCEMPMMVGETLRPPLRSFGFQYFKVLPLVAVNATPRLLVMVTIGSFATLEDWSFYLPFGAVYMGYFIVSNLIIKYWMLNRYPVLNYRYRKLIDLGLFTSMICPSVIGVFNSGFLFITSVSTTMIHSLALGSLYAIGLYHPSMIFQSSTNETESELMQLCGSNFHSTLSQEEQEARDMKYLKWYTWILVPLVLILSNFAIFCINKVFKGVNVIYKAIWAIETNKTEVINSTVLKKLNELVPGDEDKNSLLQYFIKKNGKDCARMVEKCHEEGLDLRQTNRQDKTALMLSCDFALPEVVEALFKLEKISRIKIGINVSSYFNDSNVALHFAVLSEGPIEAKKQVISLFWSYAKDLKINLFIKNDHGQTPIDILEETAQGLTCLQEIGNPKEDLNALKDALLEGDFHQALVIKNNFVMSLELAFLYTIDANEEVAVALIEHKQILNLQFNIKDEEKRTPLILACCLKRPKVALALLDQAGTIELSIEAKDDRFGYTAFIWACYNGLVDVVASMMSKMYDLKINLNAKDDLNRTGFYWACIYKHDKVVELLMAKAESHDIDIYCKDIFGKSVFDRYPQFLWQICIRPTVQHSHATSMRRRNQIQEYLSNSSNVI